MSKDNNGIGLREGRKKEQYMITDYEIIDSINDFASCETLGFYMSVKRYVNRKDHRKDNEINYTQKWLEKKFNIGTYKYYKHLHQLFNIGLLDMEKTAKVKFFINYNIEGKENPLVEKEVFYFSTLENLNLWLKGNIEKIIEEQNPEIPKELINIVEVNHKTNYIIHDYPPTDIFEGNDRKLIAYREWDQEMNKFQRGKSKSKKIEDKEVESDFDPASDKQKDPTSDKQKDPTSDKRKVNIIIEQPNTIIEPSNSIISQSSEGEIDRLTDIDKQIRNVGFKSYEDLTYDLQLHKSFYKYPISEWISTIKKSIWEMYYYDNTKINNTKISKFDIINKLQDLTIDIVISAVNQAIESSKEDVIKYPVAFMKTILFNEIDEFLARVQSQVNYDLNDDRGIDNKIQSNSKKTKFHNFIGRSEKYSEEQIESIAKRKRDEYSNKSDCIDFI